MKPLISIITTTYQYAHYINDLLSSVQNQSFKNFECIIVDDFSNDNTYDVVKKYLTDNRFQFIQFESNKGYSAAKNAGLIRSKGKYTVIIDGDDMLLPNSLKVRLRCMESRPHIQWLHAKAYEFGINKPYEFTYKERPFIKRFKLMQKKEDYRELWSCIHSQTVMTKRSVYEKVGLYEESMRSSADKEMWARILNNIGMPHYLKDFVSCYRIHDNQMHKSKEKMKNIKKIKKNLEYFINKRKLGDFEGIKLLPGDIS